MSGTHVVFVDGARVEVARTGSALDAVRLADAATADAIERGERAITDSRGLPIPPHSAAHAGAIFRIVRARAASAKRGDGRRQ